MIVWGWRTLTKFIAHGEFYCPNCATRRPYRQERLRHWFTLYFIPIIPLEQLGEQVTCSHCAKPYLTSVLNNDPEKLRADQLGRIAQDWLSLMAGVAVLSGGVTPEVAQTIVSDIQAATNRGVPPEKVGEVAATLSNSGGSARLVFGSLRDDLSPSGQERLIAAVLNVLRLQNKCGAKDLTLVYMLAGPLGMSEAHVKGVLLEAGLLAA